MRDRKFLAFVVGVQVLLALPFLFGLWLGRGSELSYNGAHILTPGDYPVYLNDLEQVKDGAVVFQNFYTTEAFPKIVNPFWLAAGGVASALALPSPWAFHLLRAGLGMVLLIVMWRFGRMFCGIDIRRWMMIALIFAGGVGTFYGAVAGQGADFYGYYGMPMDLWVPEAFGFLLLYNSPHIIASVLLMLLSFWGFIRAIDGPSLKFAAASGLSSLLLFSFHPFHVPLVWGIELIALVGWWVMQRKWEGRQARAAIIVWLLALPSVAYHLMLMLSNDLVRDRANQNLLFTPNLPVFLASYGALGLLGVVGAVMQWRNARRSFAWMMMLVWLVAQPVFFFGPFDWQRRMTQGWFIPLAVFGAFATEKLVRRWLRHGYRPARMIEVGLVGVMLLYFSPLYTLVSDFRYLAESSTQQAQSRSFFTGEEIELFRALHRVTDERDVILADLLSNLLPGFVNRRVFMGHGVETLNFQTKYDQATTFFDGRWSERQSLNFLLSEGITTVIFRNARDGQHPLFNDPAHVVFENATFKVWRRRSGEAL